MKEPIIQEDLLFNVTDVFGKKVRITRNYWQKIKSEKHKELAYNYKDIIQVLTNPDEVYISVRDLYIRLFYKKIEDDTLVVLVKYLDGEGFVVTAYQTTKVKRKGEKIWPK